MPMPDPSANSRQKILEVEGLRALAITMVLAFHFFARWSTPIYPQDTYPHKIEIARVVSQFGYMGVQLFFMVSGFVILCSLEHQASFTSFVKARIKRLYPSLWISMPIIFIVCNLLNQEFIAPIPVSSLLPSLTLIGPDFLNYLLSTKFTWTTGVLWSLFIEIQFYIISGALFFNLKKFSFLTKMFAFALSLQLLKIIVSITDISLKNALDALLPLNNYIWWFLAGSTFWKITKSQNSHKLESVALISLLFNLVTMNYTGSYFKISLIPSSISFLCYALFYFIANSPKKVSFLRAPHIVWLGGLSYEFYLIHESIGISVISKINQFEHFHINLAGYLLLLTIIIVLLMVLSALIKFFSQKSLTAVEGLFSAFKFF